jgi:hypothetical protein
MTDNLGRKGTLCHRIMNCGLKGKGHGGKFEGFERYFLIIVTSQQWNGQPEGVVSISWELRAEESFTKW